jgi:hypothetical protein
MRRIGAVGVAGALVGGSALAAIGQPAAAAGDVTSITPASWAYVDSRTPNTTYLNPAGDIPVGKIQHAGADHIYRSYLTFDLREFRGRQIERVQLFGPETRATDCVRRSVELWTTAAVTPTSTWKRQPAWQRKISDAVASPGTTCPNPRIAWDATTAVRQAVAAGQEQLTLGLRATDEHRPKLGRWFGNLQMTIVYNTPPDVPVPVNTAGKPCATEAPYPWLATLEPMLSASATDPDGGATEVTFAVWPVDDPARRTELAVHGSSGSEHRLIVRAGIIEDGRSYGWSARTTDPDGARSGWSITCHFQTDATHPADPPVVSSTDFPADGDGGGLQGIPGQFTFAANGVADVAGYGWGWFGTPTEYVAAGELGGSVRVSVTPERFTNSLTVVTFDRAGNVSPAERYWFNVRPTVPVVTSSGRPTAGRPLAMTLQQGIDLPGYEVISYTYTVNEGPATTVEALPDGTATAAVPLEYGANSIVVTSRSANGWVSPEYRTSEYADYSPTITSADFPENSEGGAVGQPGAFTLIPNLADSTTVFYSFDWGSTWQEVPVGSDNRATFTWTPPRAGGQSLVAYSQTVDGTQSDWGYYDFSVGG